MGRRRNGGKREMRERECWKREQGKNGKGEKEERSGKVVCGEVEERSLGRGGERK